MPYKGYHGHLLKTTLLENDQKCLIFQYSRKIEQRELCIFPLFNPDTYMKSTQKSRYDSKLCKYVPGLKCGKTTFHSLGPSGLARSTLEITCKCNSVKDVRLAKRLRSMALKLLLSSLKARNFGTPRNAVGCIEPIRQDQF